MSGTYLDPLTASFVLTSAPDFQRVDNPVLQSVYIRLTTRRGSCFWDLGFGSTLQELQRLKAGPTILREVETRVRDALQPMVDAGELLELDVTAEKVARDRVDLVLSAQDAGRRPLRFTTFVRV